MPKQTPSSYFIFPTQKWYILPIQLLLVLLFIPMRVYPPEEWEILSHVFLNLNMDSIPSILNFTETKYSEED